MFQKKLGFGLMRLPLNNPDDYHDVDMDTYMKMVDLFIESGFNYFDTAYTYFSSEECTKKALVERYPRSSFFLADKMPMYMVKSYEDHQRLFDEQLQKTGAGYFDIYLLHSIVEDYYKTAQELKSFEFIKQIKTEGKARKIGFSFHGEADLLDEILTAHPEVEIVQLQINYLDWDNEGIQSRKCYDVAVNHNKPVIVMEPVKGGMLANVPESAEKLFKKRHSNLSAASWAIRYAASLDHVVMVLSGMSTMEQMQDNISYMIDLVPLDDQEHSVIKEAVKIIDESIEIPCTACGYCLSECPKGILIPNYFGLYNNMKQMGEAPFYPQQVNYNSYIKKSGKASDCIACGKCEKRCPQQLKIIDHLKTVAGTLEQ